ncbi:MAG TPA: 30S ribosome-binding factor RbfA [Polyangiaceae bacterium]|nr:30S ribosome-binding factor RbfA [Polyangiaceae bacterium]
MSDGKRPRRVAEAIRKYIAEAFTREFFDPRLAGLMVTRVEVSADLSTARVHVRPAVPSADPAARREIEKAANRAAHTLRRALGAQLGLKKTPALTFFYDAGQDAIDRVEALLGEIEREGGLPK